MCGGRRPLFVFGAGLTVESGKLAAADARGMQMRRGMRSSRTTMLEMKGVVKGVVASKTPTCRVMGCHLPKFRARHPQISFINFTIYRPIFWIIVSKFLLNGFRVAS
jgi:hypothetical protein